MDAPNYEQLMAMPKHQVVQLYLDKRKRERYARAKWRSYRNRYVRLRDSIREKESE